MYIKVHHLTQDLPTPQSQSSPQLLSLFILKPEIFLAFEIHVYLTFLIFVFCPANHKIFMTRPFEGFAKLWAELPPASLVL